MLYTIKIKNIITNPVEVCILTFQSHMRYQVEGAGLLEPGDTFEGGSHVVAAWDALGPAPHKLLACQPLTLSGTNPVIELLINGSSIGIITPVTG